MDTFFNLLKTGMVATISLVFAFTVVYSPVPQTTNKAEAIFGVGDTVFCINCAAEYVLDAVRWAADIAEQLAQTASLLAIEFKEYVLDGAAWVIAKVAISLIIDSIIEWANNGFQGRPMFVEDIQGFLREAADRGFGEYIDELGGLGSFLCDPFKLDIQIALQLQYQRSRVDRPAPDCTLTGIIDNIEGFISGTQGSFSQGGWNDWFDMTSQPSVYTPYGAYLAAESGAQARITSIKGEEINLLDFGNGFLSAKECTDADGDGDKETCVVTSPGKILQESLSFGVDSERESLVAADEIDELIGALIGAAARKIFDSASDFVRGI